MKSIKMRAIREMSYQGKQIQVGEVFEIAEERLKQAADHFQKQGMAIPLDEELEKEIEHETRRGANFVLKDYEYFLNLKKDDRFLIEDFIYPKTTIMLYSPPGQFKSLLALYAALCISNGKKFLGLETKQEPVLYCDKENNEQILKERLIGLYKGMGLEETRFPFNMLVRNGSLDDANFVYDLKETIRENKVKLVIFDTLHRFSDYEENSADHINRLYTGIFQPLTDELDCSVMFLHHTNKEGGYRGSADFLGMVDTSYSVKRKRHTNKFDIINEKSRSGEIETIAAELDFNEDIIIIEKRDKTQEQESDNEDAIKFRELVGIIKELFPMQKQTQKRNTIFTDIQIKHKDYYSESTIRRVLSWMSEKSMFHNDKKGNYTRLWENELEI